MESPSSNINAAGDVNARIISKSASFETRRVRGLPVSSSVQFHLQQEQEEEWSGELDDTSSGNGQEGQSDFEAEGGSQPWMENDSDGFKANRSESDDASNATFEPQDDETEATHLECVSEPAALTDGREDDLVNGKEFVIMRGGRCAN
jgi:hypothetical protein